MYVTHCTQRMTDGQNLQLFIVMDNVEISEILRTVPRLPRAIDLMISVLRATIETQLLDIYVVMRLLGLHYVVTNN